VVGVVAEAGAGKSRLCFELVERCRARGIRVDEAHCPAHGRNASYVALLELLRGMLGVSERDAAPEARRKIAAELLSLDPSFEALLPLVFEFLGVPDAERPAPQLPPDARQRQLVAFLRQLVKARSEREPNVLLVDDAHWIDPASDAFLAHVVEAVPGTRTLVVVNFRPEYHAPWMSRSSYRQLPLPSFGPGATAALLTDLLGSDASLAGLADRIHARTGGNPFFIEEVVQSLAESGALVGARGVRRLVAPVEEIEIPGTVQSVLSARIDRLPEREKRLLQLASVIGKEVPGGILERVAELPAVELSTALAALVARELLFEKALYPETEYAFQHPLTQEAAYRSQLAGPRARTHAAVAKALEELDADRLDERAVLLAHHWEQAGEPLVAARWMIRGAHGTNNDPTASIRLWQAARRLLSKTGGSEQGAQLELEACRGLLLGAWFAAAEADEIAAAFARGVELAESAGDRWMLCQLHLHFAVWNGLVRFDIPAFGSHAQRAAELAEEVGDEGAGMAAASGLALVSFVEGRIARAIDLGGRAFARAPHDPLGAAYWRPPPVMWLQGFTHYLRGLAGRPAESLEAIERLASGVRGEPTADVFREGLLRMWATHQAELLGDAPAALANARRMRETTQRWGTVSVAAASHYCLGIAHGLEGDVGEALRCLERAAAIHRESGGGPPPELLTVPSRLGVAYAGVGQSERALEAAARGVALVRALRMPVFLAITLLMQAQVLRKTQGAEARAAIEAALAEAEGLIESTGIRGWQPFLHVARAELAQLVGDEATRERELREAQRLFTEMGAAGHVARLEGELGRLPL
jgi:adenylate cyclase